jgi:hypothetical protein
MEIKKLTTHRPEKRKPHSYKVIDSYYKSAMKRAKSEKATLAKIIEEVVQAYATGALTVHFLKPEKKKQ